MAFDENAVWKEPEPEALTAADVREIIREHDRRLAARLREREAEWLEAESRGEVTMVPKWPGQLADILEADDA